MTIAWLTVHCPIYQPFLLTLSSIMTQETPNIRITFVQRRPNVFDIGSKLIVHMLYKCFVFTVETIQPHNRGCTWVRKRIQRTAERQF